MPVIDILSHGTTGGFPNMANPKPPVRSEIGGWSTSSSKRNTRWLRSVSTESLTESGYACTLTLRHCPASPNDWSKLRNAFFQRLRRLGVIRAHWVVEWQRRRVPHLHMALWFNQSDMSRTVIAQWCELTQHYDSKPLAQTCKPIHQFVGWAEYVAKHSSRGMNHYQRCKDARPEHWDKSGRIWGYFGDWKTYKPVRCEISQQAFYRYRRALKRFFIAKHRARREWKKVTFYRQSLKCPDRARSATRGVNDWIDHSTSLRIIYSVSGPMELLINPTRNTRHQQRLVQR